MTRGVGAAIAALALLALSACASQKGVDLPDISRWESREAILGQLDQWQFNGRIAVKTDDEGKVLSFAEKSAAGPGLINSGTYVFGAQVVDSIAAGPRSLEREVFPALIGNGLYGMCGQGFFLDLGTPESLQALQNDPAEFLRAVYGETGA